MSTNYARPILSAVPVLLVNGVAITGQVMFWRTHLASWPLPAVVAFAVALESVAVYLGYYAHLALVSNDAALRLRTASYGLGAVVGGMNASHYLQHGRITAAALGMGLMSAVSPWLWSIYSRRASRDELLRLGLIDAHAVRLGSTRWLLFPVRSFRVFRDAAWDGVSSLSEALTPPSLLLGDVESKADVIRIAVNYVGADPVAVAAWIRKNAAYMPASVRAIPLSYVRLHLARDSARGIDSPAYLELSADEMGEIPALANGNGSGQVSKSDFRTGILPSPVQPGQIYRAGCNHQVEAQRVVRIGDLHPCPVCQQDTPYLGGMALTELLAKSSTPAK